MERLKKSLVVTALLHLFCESLQGVKAVVHDPAQNVLVPAETVELPVGRVPGYKRIGYNWNASGIIDVEAGSQAYRHGLKQYIGYHVRYLKVVNSTTKEVFKKL